MDIYPWGDIPLIVIGIYSAQSETSAALKERGQTDITHASLRQCIEGDLNLHWLSSNSVAIQKLCLESNLNQLISSLIVPNNTNPLISIPINLISTIKPYSVQSNSNYILS